MNITILTIGSVFLVYTLILGQELTSEKAFVTLASIGLLSGPLREIPNIISQTIKAYVSSKRIKKLMDTPEIQKIQ